MVGFSSSRHPGMQHRLKKNLTLDVLDQFNIIVYY